MKGLVLTDLHFGIKGTAKLYSELQQVITLLQKEHFDLLVIGGDYFNAKISLNEQASRLALKFMDELVQCCKDQKIILRIIKGTNSHDLNQLDNFGHYYSDAGLNFRMFNVADSEELAINGESFKILYLPEEYPVDSKAYLNEVAKNGPYDLIFGHGMCEFTAFSGMKQESEREVSNPVIFPYEWFCKNCIGPVIFGHIHTRTIDRNKIFYPGSFTRWCYGEESEKGFATFEYEKSTGEYSVTFIDNLLAPKYNTFKVSELEGLDQMSIEELLMKLNAIKKQSENTRFDVTGIPEDKLALIKESYSEDASVKIKEKVTSILNDSHKLNSQFDFIIEDQLPVNEVIQKYIEVTSHKTIPIEVINNIIAKN